MYYGSHRELHYTGNRTGTVLYLILQRALRSSRYSDLRVRYLMGKGKDAKITKEKKPSNFAM
jgi:hypothetical protein